MAIIKTQGYKASDGVVYATVEEAQASEVKSVFYAADHPDQHTATWTVDEIANLILSQREELLAILTTGPKSRPKARKAAGTTNPKRAVKRATPEQAAAGFAGMRRAAAAPATEAPELEPCDTAAYVTNGSD